MHNDVVNGAGMRLKVRVPVPTEGDSMAKIPLHKIGQFRRAHDASLKPARRKLLSVHSCDQAKKLVPRPEDRRAICDEARKLGASKSTPLGKKALAVIDARLLAQGRNPDPKYVRWVLRCAGLHPQGRGT
jgi:hypothetical protein